MSTENLHEETDDIAIIGMAGRFPGAPDLERFWRNLQNGVESISRFTEEELLDSGFPLEVIRHPDFVSAKAILDDADMFDAAFFGISPREAELMDPQHRLLMECAWQSLEDAGYDSERYAGRIAVFTSTGLNTYLPFNICSHPGLALKVGGFQLSICNDKDFVATRIAYAMNLKGAGVNISTACSSSLVSLHFACQHLLTHQSDMALIGAVTVHFPQKVGHIYEAGAAYSPDGHCRPFDATPSGLIDGNGVASVVLKRLDDAVAAGDYIYAVVKGTAINNDGRQKVGYTAPSIEGQTAVISEALEMAGVAADTISYVEAHGTATPLGDPIEVEGLMHAFRKGTQRTGFCGLGSVKSNIGHVDTAAGLAGLMKVALGMKHGQLPPSLHFQLPNPKLNLEDSPFYVVGELREWPRGDHHPRRAGISSFGVGGTNAHAIIEEAPDANPATPSRSPQLLMLSAKTPSALQDALRRLASYLKEHPQVELADVAYTLQVGRRMFNRRAFVSASSTTEGVAALEDPKRIRTGVADEAGVAFMFPGQGSQYPEMARDLYERESKFREEFDRCSELLKPELGQDLRRIVFAETGATSDAAAELHQTAVAQPALFAVEYALASLWMSWGIRPAAMIGHSIGEYVAACLAGVFSLPDALKIVTMRGRLMQAMQPGVMLAVPLPEEEVNPLLEGLMEIAAVNSPSTCVVSGPFAAAEKFEARLTERNLVYQRLHTSHAFHSAMMEPMLKPFLEILESIHFHPPQIPFISNRTGSWISADDAVRPAYWAEHLRHTVRFSAGLKCLMTESPIILLEVGPGRTLAGLARQIGGAAKPPCHSSLPHASESIDDQNFLLATLGELWLSGAPVDWPAYYRNERRRRIPLPTYPFQRQRYWIEPRKPEQVDATRPVDQQFIPKESNEQIETRTVDDTLHRHERPDLASDYVAPRTMQESALADIWQELLGVSKIGIHDNFFELGGHSLLGAQILTRLKQDHGVALELKTLFEHQTIAALASAWLSQTAAPEDDDLLSRLVDALDNMSEADVAIHLQSDTVPAELLVANLAPVVEAEQPEGPVEATPHESGRIFPLVLRPTGAIDLATWAQENRQYLQRQLTRYGAVLFKGFRIDGTEGFGRVARSLNGDLLAYTERTSPRHEVSDRIFTATDYPASQSIFLHNENSYAHTIPTKLLFYCAKPAQQGGETPIADCRRVLQRIDPEIVERFVKLKWMYVRNFSDQFGLSWQTAFQTTNKRELEAYCRQQDIEYEWRSGDLLRTRQIREAVIYHPHDGTPVWFNHATFFHVTTLEPSVRKVLLETFAEADLPNNTYYGDGSSIEPEVIDSLRRAYDEETATFPWEEHDLLLLDNLSTAHSRRPFTGPREILVAMSESVNRSELVVRRKAQGKQA